jgi:hypothetical protein
MRPRLYPATSLLWDCWWPTDLGSLWRLTKRKLPKTCWRVCKLILTPAGMRAHASNARMRLSAEKIRNACIRAFHGAVRHRHRAVHCAEALSWEREGAFLSPHSTPSPRKIDVRSKWLWPGHELLTFIHSWKWYYAHYIKAWFCAIVVFLNKLA